MRSDSASCNFELLMQGVHVGIEVVRSTNSLVRAADWHKFTPDLQHANHHPNEAADHRRSRPNVKCLGVLGLVRGFFVTIKVDSWGYGYWIVNNIIFYHYIRCFCSYFRDQYIFFKEMHSPSFLVANVNLCISHTQWIILNCARPQRIIKIILM